MKNSLKKYIEYLEKLPKKETKNNKELQQEILLQIKHFQHERLIHLIVTVFVGIVSILIFGFALILENTYLMILFLILLCLFIPYIFHYYYLENGVQKLYKIYWDTTKK